jgi:DNA helicase-2/ATP-dependent DNA helicase PcrA
MVAETIRAQLGSWEPGRGGIAALSFTRVGGEEVRSALGHAMPHPHFVGTIDAFLFRYVVRPHIRAIDASAKTPELIPVDWRPEEIWTTTKFGGSRGINPYACVWTGRDSKGKPTLVHVVKNRLATPLNPEEFEAVRRFKGNLLRNKGRITLSDSALFASIILQKPGLGPLVRAEIARRFPLVIVDELQDTGVFLAESLKALLEEPETRGLLVGDPDQAIYEFNGAAPEMFDTFAALPAAELLELRTTRRCPASATAVASHLKRSGSEMFPAEGRSGQAMLVRYDSMGADVAAIAAACRRARPHDLIKVIARSNTTVDALTGRAGGELPTLWCAPATLLHRAVRHFRAARSVSALASARAVLERVALAGEAFTADELRAKGVEPTALRGAALDLLMDANALPTIGTNLDWQLAARELAVDHASRFCAAIGLAAPDAPPKPQKRDGYGAKVADSLRGASAAGAFAGVPVVTVHGVKGETHDVTIFVSPPTTGKAGTKKCPTTLWWPAAGVDDEERRIAYVAMTRTRGDLIVCIDEAAYKRIAAARADFLTCFTCLTVEEFVTHAAVGLLAAAA